MSWPDSWVVCCSRRAACAPSRSRSPLLRPRSPEDRIIERSIDVTKPLLLGAENLTTHDTGFFRLEPGASPKLLLMGARSYGTPAKARDADVYILTVQTFSPCVVT